MEREDYRHVLIMLYQSVEKTLDALNPLLKSHCELWQHEVMRKKLMDDICSLFRVCIVERLGHIKSDIKQ